MPLPVVAPAVWALAAGSGAASAYAWYDPDLFTQGLWSNYDLDKRVEVLNNYWQNLWRSGGNRLPPSSQAAKDLDRYMAGWWDFKKRYDASIFKRAIDPFGMWGAKADFESELTTIWLPRFTNTLQAAIVQDPSIRNEMDRRNVDVETYLERSGLDSDGQPKGSNFGLYFGVALTVTLIGVGALLAARKG